MVCKEHNDLTAVLNKIQTDIAVIKNTLLGNEGKNDGIVDKVNRHDIYFYISYGCIIVLGWLYGFKA
jgi:hypothetical protein